MSVIKQTPNLSIFNGSFPKPLAKEKKARKPLGIGKKTKQWNEGRAKLKQIFRENGIVECEVHFEKCKVKNYLGFAHVRRRVKLATEEIIDPHFVILACQSCHYILDFGMQRVNAEMFMNRIVASRGW